MAGEFPPPKLFTDWIKLITTTGTKIYGNYIGTDATGQLAKGNRKNGILIGDPDANKHLVKPYRAPWSLDTI